MTDSIKKLTIRLGEKLKQREWKLVTAESCTGGGLAYFITDIAGSSAWLERGYVTYSNAAKCESLGVNPATITQFGAVSEQTAIEMARGALMHSEAQVSMAITGIAGPGGGSREKPVGTVWFGWTTVAMDKVATAMRCFTGDRQAVREQAIVFALECLEEI